MSQKRYLTDIPFEVVFTWRSFGEAMFLIRRRKLWAGFWSYGWVTAILFVVLALVGIQFLSEIVDLIRAGSTEGVAAAEALDMNRIREMVDGLFIVGSWKYVVLILGEVLVFHLLRRTIEIIGGPEQDDSFTAFLAAQKRMIAVAFFSWIMELVATILLAVLLGILGLSVLKTPLIFLVQAYFLGFAMTDNYFERYGHSIRESHRINLQLIGVSLGVGVLLYALFLVPLIGPIFGTAIGAVAAAITLYHLEERGHFTLTAPQHSSTEKIQKP